MGILEVLTVVFVTLKLTGTGAVASWSWLAVFSPLIPAAIIYTLIFLLYNIATIAKHYK